MKSKRILITIMLISSIFILYGCSNSNSKETFTKENTTAKSETTVENNSTQNKLNEETDSTKSETKSENNSSKSKEKIETNSNKNEATQKSNKAAEDSNLLYKSKLGFSIKFPSSWKDRYIIKEEQNSMYVYFKATDKNIPQGSGLIFVIMKNNDSADERMYDSIESKTHITVGNITYFVGGPTDVGLDPENKEFNIYSSMKKESSKVLDTITSLN